MTKTSQTMTDKHTQKTTKFHPYVMASVIEDSINEWGQRLTTFEVTFPRFILAEVNTHRQLSRSYRSSRAVPTIKLLKELRESPSGPMHWGLNQPGMDAAAEVPYQAMEAAKDVWIRAAQEAADRAEELLALGLHKQVANRLLEPFLVVHGVLSATHWDNFFGLRLHPAQPEFNYLAQVMWADYQRSKPKLLLPGDWHLPYITELDRARALVHCKDNIDEALKLLKAVSAARCARVSYKPFDADRPSTSEEDAELFQKLAGSAPIHASPLEHQATPDRVTLEGFWANQHLHGNFEGFIQHRKELPGEDCAPLPEEYAKKLVAKHEAEAKNPE